jgi:hypothetical protein
MTAEWKSESWERPWAIFRGFRIRVGVTAAILLGGLVWLVLYLVLLAERFPWYDNLVVILATLVLAPVTVLGMWISWGMRLRRRMRGWVDPEVESW